MYSDSEAMQGKGREERCRYGKLIVELAAEKGFPGRDRFFLGAAESRNKIVYRRRISEIMGDRKHKVVLAAVMAVAVCMAGGITTFAYEPADTYVGSDYEDGEEIIASSEPLESKWENLPCDYYFIDEYENIYTAGSGNENGRSACTHQYISGNVVRHKRDGKGGCAVREWEAKRCKWCGDMIEGKLLSTITYMPCPH